MGQSMGGFSGTLLGDQTLLTFPQDEILPLVGVLNQQHQGQNERTCLSPVQGAFPILHEEQKPIRNHTKQDLYAA